MPTDFLSSARKQFAYYKQLGEQALSQVSDAQLRLSVAPCQAAPVHVAVAGNKVLAVHPGQHLQFPLPGRRPDTATNNDPGGTAPSTPRPPPRAGGTPGE